MYGDEQVKANLRVCSYFFNTWWLLHISPTFNIIRFFILPTQCYLWASPDSPRETFALKAITGLSSYLIWTLCFL